LARAATENVGCTDCASLQQWEKPYSFVLYS
jgi:hypothetical protein